MSEDDHSAEWGDQETIPFAPDHVISEATAVILLLAFFTLLAIFVPTHLDIKVDPASTPVGIKPEWYFLFLFEFLHFVPTLVGTLLPVVGLAFLAFLPWIDRNPARNPKKRPLAMAIFFFLMLGIFVLSYMGWTG